MSKWGIPTAAPHTHIPFRVRSMYQQGMNVVPRLPTTIGAPTTTPSVVDSQVYDAEALSIQQAMTQWELKDGMSFAGGKMALPTIGRNGYSYTDFKDKQGHVLGGLLMHGPEYCCTKCTSESQISETYAVCIITD